MDSKRAVAIRSCSPETRAATRGAGASPAIVRPGSAIGMQATVAPQRFDPVA